VTRPSGRSAALALCVVVLGCVTPRNAAGTTASGCFRALPQAAAAVGRRGKLVGVRSVTGTSAGLLLRRTAGLPNQGALTPRPSLPPSTQVPGGANTVPPGRRGVCLFAFDGHFQASDLSARRVGPLVSARYAIVATGLRRPRVIGVVLVERLPTRFSHRAV
jgi:hypothetical protein